MAVEDDLSFVEETMKQVKRNWNPMLQDNFNPIMAALEILQKSDGEEYDNFCALNAKMERAQSVIVNKYYSGFNNTISIFTGIVQNTRASHEIISNLCQDLDNFKDHIQFKRTELPATWERVQTFKAAISASQKLDLIVKQQQCIHEASKKKFWIPASTQLMKAIAETEALQESSSSLVDATHLLHVLEADRADLFDSLVEECFQCLFAAAAENFQSNHHQDLQPHNKDIFTSIKNSLDNRTPDFVQDPRENSLCYLASIIKASTIIQSEESLLTVITQRLSIELYSLAHASLGEARNRAKQSDLGVVGKATNGSMNYASRNGNQSITGNANTPNQHDQIVETVIDKYFGGTINICQRLFFIAKFIEDSPLVDGHNFIKNCLVTIHGQVKGLLSSLLTHPQSNNASASTLSEAVRNAFDNDATRAATNTSFNFADSSELADGSRSANDPLLSLVLSQDQIMSSRKLSTMMASDPFSSTLDSVQDRNSSNLYSLITPSISHLPLLYHKLARFNEKLTEFFASDQSQNVFVDQCFVDEAMVIDWLPWMQSRIKSMVSEAFSTNSGDLKVAPLMPQQQAGGEGSTDFIPIAVGRYSRNGLEAFTTFTDSFIYVLTMLPLLPGCGEDVEGVLLRICEGLVERSRNLLTCLLTNSNTQGTPFTAYTWIQSSKELSETLQGLSLMISDGGSGSRREHLKDRKGDEILEEMEGIIYERLKSHRSIHQNEMINDKRIFKSLCALQRSLDLLPECLMMVEADSRNSNLYNVDIRPWISHNTRGENNNQLFLNYHDKEGGIGDGLLKSIAFSPTFCTQFTAFLSCLREISVQILMILRSEVRIHCLYYVDLASLEGDYGSVGDEGTGVVNADAYICKMVTDLLEIEGQLSDWMPFTLYHLIFDGLGGSIARQLVNAFANIRSLSTNGCRKLLANVVCISRALSLFSLGDCDDGSNSDHQNTLKMARKNASWSLDFAKEFFELASLGPIDFLDALDALSHTFTLRQLKSIIHVYARGTDDKEELAAFDALEKRLEKTMAVVNGKEKADSSDADSIGNDGEDADNVNIIDA